MRGLSILVATGLWYSQQESVDAAGVFSKQIQCDTQTGAAESKPGCREVLAGVIHLSADEAFEFETFNVRDLDDSSSPSSSASDDDSMTDNDTIIHDQFFPLTDDNNPLKDVTVNLKIEKSPLLVAYDLVYEKTVAGGISEDVYDYTWAAASGSGVFEHSDFEPERCTNKKTLHELRSQFGDSVNDVHEVKTIIQGGKVCGCQETGWGSSRYSGVRRSTLNCNAWPAVFRPSTTVWASRHCPRLHSPTFSVYSLRNWRWDFQIKVSLEWVARPDGHSARPPSSAEDGQNSQPTLRREYLLNWTAPEAYDEEFDFRFKIVFSLPQAGALPPDLSSKYLLLIPDVPMQELRLEPLELSESSGEPLKAALLRLPPSILRLNQLRTSSMLLPADQIDLSGKTCEKVGVSLHTWAEELQVERQHLNTTSWIASERFCAQNAGSCLRNQPNDLLALDKKRTSRGETAKLILAEQGLDGWSSERPLLLATSSHMLEDNSYKLDDEEEDLSLVTVPIPKHLAWATDVAHNTVLEMFLNSTEIAWMAGSARGSLEDVLTHSLDASRLIQITGVVRNKDSFASRFTLASSRCERTAGIGVSDTNNLTDFAELDDYVEISPVSRTVGPDHAEGFTLTAERVNSVEEASYYCDIQLWDAKGQRVDSRPLEISFAPRALSVVTLEKPVNSIANVSHFVVQKENGDPTLWDVMNGLRAPQIGDVLGTDGHTRVSSVEWDSPGVCDCSFINVWCIASNFVECTRRIRQVATIAIVMFATAMGALICGPTLIHIIFSLSRSLFHFSRKRWKRMAVEIQTTKQPKRKSSLLPICAAELLDKPSVGSVSTHNTTPCNRDVVHRHSLDSNTPSPMDRDLLWGMPPAMAAVFFRESLLNTRGRHLAAEIRGSEPSTVNCGTRVPPLDNPTFKVETCEADSEISDLEATKQLALKLAAKGSRSTRNSRPSSARNYRAPAGRMANMTIVKEELSSSDPDNCVQATIPRYMCWSPPRRAKCQEVRQNRSKQRDVYGSRRPSTVYSSSTVGQHYVKKKAKDSHNFITLPRGVESTSSPTRSPGRNFRHAAPLSSSDNEGWKRLEREAELRTRVSRSRRGAVRPTPRPQPAVESSSRPSSRKSRNGGHNPRELRMQEFMVSRCKSGSLVRQQSTQRHVSTISRHAVQNPSVSAAECGSSAEEV